MQSKELWFSGTVISSAPSIDALARAARLLLFICFTTIGAQLAVDLPFTPVPLTMQTLFVVLAGVTLGARDGFYAMLSYLAIGLAGAPVFACFYCGPAALLGPTGGYLVSFPAAALLSGYLCEKRTSSRLVVFASSLCGMALILVSGASYLAFMSGVSISRAVSLAIVPFIPGELVKALIAAFIAVRKSRPAEYL